MSGLKLANVKKSFGAVEVIKGVDLEIADKEFVVFVGPSGCGKSTLLRMIAGLEQITSGDLTIGDKRMNEVDPSQRGIAMVFQTYALYPHMTVRENMGFALKFAGAPKAEIEQRVQEAARILELGPLLERRPGQLSGGQRQRVAIGRAIVRHPDVFLFDEPLSNLDAELRVHMRIEIARLHQELNTTIIYVTHDQVEAMTLADKIVVLRDGRIEQVGSPLDLYDNPDNIFVAGFIGSPKMNFLEGTAETDGIRLTDFPGQIIPSPVAVAPGTPVTVGIRPEHFSAEGSAALDVNVEIIEHLGGETYAYARDTGRELITIATDNNRTLKTGDRYSARFDPADLLVFGQDGMRIR
ncbi:ABC transporter ATP-binding protein [Devosia sediminis]|uniref:Sn-glycerol-3-phosphate ABC transporter ATP-binding protein UgpC n=1 Tax=Devosia sediminis TaxID=2798801 RepID=A0A934IWV9_9HYPH|nr:sn-glycerol-3-phosphate ABC transporter ATP-binding protein UgpC [Devosia sediminis]MBJ3784601.1 sn-glycerol-3-phosphate ABC transporter ATP-binding protein UgpC [Devosia sediminis]